MDELLRLWSNSGFQKPKLLYGFYENKWYLTTSDNSSIISFISDEGNIYSGVKSKCIETPLNNPTHYSVESGRLQIVTCSTKKSYNPLDL